MQDRQLTEHFRLAELTVSQTATRLGIPIEPSEKIIAKLVQVAQALEVVRAHFDRPIISSSGYRPPELNAAIGGASKTSAHMLGLADDFTVQGVPNIEVCIWIATASGIAFDQVIYEFGPAPGGWVHLGLAQSPRHQALTAIHRDGRTVYEPGIKDLWG